MLATPYMIQSVRKANLVVSQELEDDEQGGILLTSPRDGFLDRVNVHWNIMITQR